MADINSKFVGDGIFLTQLNVQPQLALPPANDGYGGLGTVDLLSGSTDGRRILGTLVQGPGTGWPITSDTTWYIFFKANSAQHFLTDGGLLTLRYELVKLEEI